MPQSINMTSCYYTPCTCRDGSASNTVHTRRRGVSIHIYKNRLEVPATAGQCTAARGCRHHHKGIMESTRKEAGLSCAQKLEAPKNRHQQPF